MSRNDEVLEAVREFFEERAAIMEFAGRLSRAESEKRARAEAVAYLERLKRGTYGH